MPASEVSICNRALQMIGARSTIAALNESSPEARNCSIVYESTRDEMLGMAFWNFARKTANLALLKSAPGTPSYTGTPPQTWNSTLPSPPWLFEYGYPSDCLQMRMIVPQLATWYAGEAPIFPAGGGVPSTVGFGPPVFFTPATDTNDQDQQINVILTNQYQAIAIYTKRMIDPALYPAQFTEALASAIAMKIAMPLTGDKGLRQQLIALTNDYVTRARATDGNEGLTVQDSIPDWIQIREGGFLAPNGFYVAPYPALWSVW